MTTSGYREEELVSNRSALVLCGGTEEDRRAWAHAAAARFADEGPPLEVRASQELAAALARPRGVVFLPDALALGDAAQREVLRCLLEQEERPKLVVGVPGRLADARAKGLFRDDLAYRLQAACVDLSQPPADAALRQRRQEAQAARADWAAQERPRPPPPAPARRGRAPKPSPAKATRAAARSGAKLRAKRRR